MSPEHKPSNEQPPTPEEREAERRRRIAVEAYYNAERRGFAEGGDVDDWLAAERLVDGSAGSRGEGPDSEAPSEGGGDAVPADADQRIEPDQVKTWARQLNVSAPRLREAIRRVGPAVRDVKQYLESAPPPA